MVNNEAWRIAIYDMSYIFLYYTPTLYTNIKYIYYVGKTHVCP